MYMFLFLFIVLIPYRYTITLSLVPVLHTLFFLLFCFMSGVRQSPLLLISKEKL